MRWFLPTLLLAASCADPDFTVGLSRDDTGETPEDGALEASDSVTADSRDTGIDTGAPDTAPPTDTGIDTGSPPTDTGTDTGSPPTDTGTDTGSPDTGIPDTGSPTDTAPPDTGTTGEYNTTFPNALDGKSIANDPLFWQTGDYYSGIRNTGLKQITGLSGTIHMKANELTCSQVDLAVKLESGVVGSVTILPGATSTPFSLTFAPVSAGGGTTYSLMYVAKSSTSSGCGSVTFKVDVSSITFKGSK